MGVCIKSLSALYPLIFKSSISFLQKNHAFISFCEFQDHVQRGLVEVLTLLPLSAATSSVKESFAARRANGPISVELANIHSKFHEQFIQFQESVLG